MVSTNRGICTKLNIGVTLSSQNHAISLLKRDEIVNFRLFVIVLVNRVQDQVRLLDFGELDEKVNLIIDVNRVGQFNFTQLALKALPIYLGDLVYLHRVQLSCEPLFETLKMRIFRTAYAVANRYEWVAMLALIHAYPAFKFPII
jgi:hypothetical protein